MNNIKGNKENEKVVGEAIEESNRTAEQIKTEKELRLWKRKKSKYKPTKGLKVPQEIIGCLLKSKDYNGVIFSGEGGIGKSVVTLSIVKKLLKPREWEYSNGYITPLALYQLLYEQRNKKVIILDDIEGIFNNKLSLSILKSALWDCEGKRICQYSSTSEKLEIPSKFIIKSKIITLCNYIPKENDTSTRAMLSRTIHYKINLSFDTKIEMCKEFIKRENIEEEDKKLILDILLRNVTIATKDFNFRTLRKLISFVRYKKEKAEYLFKETIEEDELKLAYILSLKKDTIKEQVKSFADRTGKSRATFFRLKKSLKVSLKTYMKGGKI